MVSLTTTTRVLCILAVVREVTPFAHGVVDYACVDEPVGWKSSNGHDCKTYGDKGYCRFTGPDGIAAKDACCACGGGSAEKPDSSTNCKNDYGWKSKYGRKCDHYATSGTGDCATDKSKYDTPANKACCACGGGTYEATGEFSYSLGTSGSNDCGDEYDAIDTAGECKAAAKLLGKSYSYSFVLKNNSSYPKGCYLDSYVYFNLHATGAGRSNNTPICKFQAPTMEYSLAAKGSNDCGDNNERVSAESCQEAATSLGKVYIDKPMHGGEKGRGFSGLTRGCYHNFLNDKVYFNDHITGSPSASKSPVCLGAVPVHGGWGSYDSCNKTCGSGTKSRLCNNPTPRYGGNNCAGSASASCKVKECPVHGGWGNYDSCNKTCGSGTKSRFCNNPTPAHGGNNCAGSASASCKVKDCPVHVHGGWGSYGSCNKTCGSGTKSRSCNNPTPAYGGNTCAGSPSASCKVKDCPSTATYTIGHKGHNGCNSGQDVTMVNVPDVTACQEAAAALGKKWVEEGSYGGSIQGCLVATNDNDVYWNNYEHDNESAKWIKGTDTPICIKHIQTCAQGNAAACSDAEFVYDDSKAAVECTVGLCTQAADQGKCCVTKNPGTKCGTNMVTLTAVQSSECPANGNLSNCDDVGCGDLCEGDDECGTKGSLNNCGGWDIYRVTCHGNSALFGATEADDDTFTLSDYDADAAECTPECDCHFVGVETTMNVQFLCNDSNTCYNLVDGWCAESEHVCEIPS